MTGSDPRLARRAIPRLAFFLALLAVQVGCANTEPPPTNDAATPQGAAELRNGIDASVHVGTIDWEVVAAAGHTFAFVKATEGMDLKDAAFDQNWAQIKAAGLIRGAYHFYVTEDDPAKQAAFFIDNVVLEPGDLLPAVDVEMIGHDTRPGVPERLQAFVNLIEAHYGVKPIIYTSPNFWDAHFPHGFGAYPLWVANYGVEKPRLPAGWSEWHIWQRQQDARIPGVEKGADLNSVNRSVDLSMLIIR